MKVKELIAELKKLNPEMLVVVDGYESGLCDISLVRETTAKLNVNEYWWEGNHEQCDPNDDDAVPVCYLPR